MCLVKEGGREREGLCCGAVRAGQVVVWVGKQKRGALVGRWILEETNEASMVNDIDT